jgi:hypothetical protein
MRSIASAAFASRPRLSPTTKFAARGFLFSSTPNKINIRGAADAEGRVSCFAGCGDFVADFFAALGFAVFFAMVFPSMKRGPRGPHEVVFWCLGRDFGSGLYVFAVTMSVCIYSYATVLLCII